MPATSEEQYLLELINNARMDPMGNAARYITSYAPLASADSKIAAALRYFGVNGTALYDAFSALEAVGPLAWNDALATAAASHNAAMIAADTQSHQVSGEAALGDRLKAAGYNFIRAGENIYAFSENITYSHAGFMVDWGAGPNGMQSPAGHRDNIMSAGFTEVGIDVTSERNDKTSVGPFVVTQDFGDRGNLYITGVAYLDSDKNGLYSIGEGLEGLRVTRGNTVTSTGAAGGYTLQAAKGAATIYLTGAQLDGTVTVTTTITDQNLKLDVVNGNTLLTSGSINVTGPLDAIRVMTIAGASVTTGAGAQKIYGYGGADTLDGGGDADRLYGGAGNDHLLGGDGNDELSGDAGNDYIDGGAGIDIAFYAGNRADYAFSTRTDGGLGVSGADSGTDALYNIEFLMFRDGQFSLRELGGITNHAPTVAATQAVTTTAGTAKAITVAASDTDGDVLTLAASNPAHGTVIGTGNIFTYTPMTGYVGTDSFNVTVSDGKGGVSTQQVSVTITQPNRAPTTSASQSVTLDQGKSAQISVSATDPDGDALTFSVTGAQHGVIAGTAGSYVYTPVSGYFGTDSFVVTVRDASGASAAQTVNLTVNRAETPVDPGPVIDPTVMQYRMFVPNDYTAKISGGGSITGTNGVQDITILPQAGGVTFDGSFNRGGDTLRFSGTASSYTIAMEGSTVFIKKGSATYSIPIGAVGLNVVFDDGGRKLFFDTAADAAKIGSQSITASPVAITAPASTPPQSGNPDDDGASRLYLTTGGTVTLEGDHVVYGTTGNENIWFRGGDLTLDGSFNRGGDTLHLQFAPSHYTARMAGSTLILTSAEGEIVVPVGQAGMTIDFAGTSRTLRFDMASGKALIGSQEIPATGIVLSDIAGNIVSIDKGTAAATVAIDLSAGDNTLVDEVNVDTNVVIRNFGSGDVIEVHGAVGSDYNYTRTDADGDGQFDDLALSYRTATTDNLISVIDAIASPSAPVFDLQTAVNAVGHSFIRFGTQAPTEPVDGTGGTGGTGGSTAGTLDKGNGATTVTFALAAGNNTITDNANVDTNVVITGFNQGDVLVLQNASASDYNYTKADADKDGQVDDLALSYQSATAANLIAIVDAFANPNLAVYDFATAQAAVGYSFAQFG